jgi:hypothetical protein
VPEYRFVRRYLERRPQLKSVPAPYLLPTALWKTGANCSVTARPSPPCSTVCCTTVTS